jgi:hypothetical protein
MNCLELQQKRYKYLAYIVVRDAIGFYFGIPEFLLEDNLEDVFVRAVEEKIKELKKEKGRNLTSREFNRCLISVKRALNARIKELEEDFNNCQDVLFEDNLWLQLLDLDAMFFREYLPKLSTHIKKELAVIPKWGTRDHSLGRTYINDNFNLPVNFYA